MGGPVPGPSVQDGPVDGPDVVGGDHDGGAGRVGVRVGAQDGGRVSESIHPRLLTLLLRQQARTQRRPS